MDNFPPSIGGSAPISVVDIANDTFVLFGMDVGSGEPAGTLVEWHAPVVTDRPSAQALRLVFLANWLRLSTRTSARINATEMTVLAMALQNVLAGRGFDFSREMGLHFAELLDRLAAQVAQQDAAKGGAI